MVIGHTLEATLLMAERESPLVAAYWPWRSLTAPLFLIVSGWAVALLFSRRPLAGHGHLKERLARIGTLIGLGLLLRYPTWAVDRLIVGDPEILAHFFALDVLQLIAFCLLLGSLLAGLSRHPMIRLALTVLLCLVTVVISPAVWSFGQSQARTWGLVFGGGTSSFPLFPWLAYFLAGMTIGFASNRFGTGYRRVTFLVLVGSLMAGSIWMITGTFLPQPAVPGPTIFIQRCGLVLIGLGLFGLAPSSWGRWAAPLGRRTLSIYFFHLLVVYGGLDLPGLMRWVGRTLPLNQSLGLGILVLIASVGLSYLWTAARRIMGHVWQFLRNNWDIRGKLRT